MICQGSWHLLETGDLEGFDFDLVLWMNVLLTKLIASVFPKQNVKDKVVEPKKGYQ